MRSETEAFETTPREVVMPDTDTAPIDEDAGKPDAEEVEQDESDNLEVEYAKLAMERLTHALGFVQCEVPPFGGRTDEMHEHDQDEVPRAVQRARERALIAAYGLIAREFDGDLGGAN